MIPRKPGRQTSKQGTSFCMHHFSIAVHTRISLFFQHKITRRSIFDSASFLELKQINKDCLRFLPFGADEPDVPAAVSRNRMCCCPQQVRGEGDGKKTHQAVTIPNSAHQFFAGGLWASPHFRNSVSDSSADGSCDRSFGSGLFDSGYGSHISKSTRPLQKIRVCQLFRIDWFSSSSNMGLLMGRMK
jgi:hypothetical protein